MSAGISYKVVQKRNHNAVYAIFDMPPTLERARKWIENYDPRKWTDRTVQRDDLEIIESIPFAPAQRSNRRRRRSI